MKEIFWWSPKLNWFYPLLTIYFIITLISIIYDLIGAELQVIWVVRDIRGTVNLVFMVIYFVQVGYLLS